MFNCGRGNDVVLGPKAVAEEERLSTDQRQTRERKEGREDNYTTRPKTSSNLLENPTPLLLPNAKNHHLVWHDMRLNEDALRPVLEDRQLRLHIPLQRADFRLQVLDLGGRSLSLFHQGGVALLQGGVALLQGLDAVLVLLLDAREHICCWARRDSGVLYKIVCQC